MRRCQTILRVTYPLVELVADVDVALPACVHVRQVIDAPTSATKLIKAESDKNLNAVRRYILQRHMEVGRGRTLVIAQQEVEAKLRDKLPHGNEVTHFNALAGIDLYRDVRLLILVGRVQPGPAAVEVLAAALSGKRGVEITAEEGFGWYNRVKRGIRLPDGQGFAVDGDQHPDSFAESIRFQICEAELVQAFGRARAVNRTETCPLTVDILANTVLPITVNEVVPWREPSTLVETAAEGVMLAAPADLVRVWPDLWPNLRAAGRTLADGVPTLPGFVTVA